MGASLSSEQVSVEQKEAESAAASLGALPMLKRAFLKYANPNTKAISVLSLQRCFTLTFDTSMSKEAGVSERLSVLLNHVGLSLVDLFFRSDSEAVNWARFLEGFVRCCGRMSSSERIISLLSFFDLAASRAGVHPSLKFECNEKVEVDGSIPSSELLLFFLVCWMMQREVSAFKVYNGLPNLDDLLWSAVVSCSTDTRNLSAYDCDISAMAYELSIRKIQQWILKTVPYLADCFVQFVHARLQNLPNPEDGQEPLGAQHDISPSRRIHSDYLLTCGRAWAISCTLKGPIHEEILQVTFTNKFDVSEGNLLYRSSVHGKGLNRFWSSIEGYSGPVLMLISGSMEVQLEGRSITRKWIIGALIMEGFENKDTFYGNSGYLYAISPVFCPFSPSGRERNFVYSHLHPTGRVYDPNPKPIGIGFGGKIGNERVFMDEDFASVTIRHHAFDRTYEPGPLLPGQGFLAMEASVLEVEAWGLGGVAMMEVQMAYKDRKQLFMEQRRKVDLAMLDKWEESPEKMMMDMVSAPRGVQRQDR